MRRHTGWAHISNAILDPVVPLECSEKRWVPDVFGGGNTPTVNTPAAVLNNMPVERRVDALLNKLTMEKFDKLSDQILAISEGRADTHTGHRTHF